MIETIGAVMTIQKTEKALKIYKTIFRKIIVTEAYL